MSSVSIYHGNAYIRVQGTEGYVYYYEDAEARGFSPDPEHPHKYDYGVFEIDGHWSLSNLYLYRLVR